ncbi:MAG TPA: protein kinase [Solirubrobacteraceae bacterium]|nr:protein kinase [Solirubrobacteraceae bacterium]
MDEARFTLFADEELGTYRIEAPISSGAMGAVYRALDTSSGQPVAIKHVKDTRHAERFEVEARLLSVLRHPRVVRVLDYMQDDRGQFLVMDLVQGMDLHTLLKERGRPGLPLDEAVKYTRQTCEALRYVHEQQIVHRDVKPQNIILGEQGIVLVDFGVARLLTEEEESGTAGIGTPRFMAPEVFAGGAVSPRSDVFGLAATLWTMLTGKPPVYANPTPLTELVSGLSPQIATAIRAGLEMIPERRLASIDALARALGQRTDSTVGRSLARSVERPAARRGLMEAIVRTAAAVFQAAACSVALTDATTGELVYQSAWGAGAKEIVGVRLAPGKGLAGSVVETGEGLAVADCRNDERFAPRIAAGTGYVPYTMLVAPLMRQDTAIGAISLLDRRDGGRYESGDLERLALFAELTVAAIDADSDFVPALGADDAIDPF